MNEQPHEVVVDHMIIHGPLTASRADHAERIRQELSRIVRQQGPEGLTDGELTLPPEAGGRSR